MEKELLELLADLEHKRWSKWQRYLHDCCIKNSDGSLIIPKEKVEHWEQQIKTDYINLTEKEKESDRRQVYKTLELIKAYFKKNKQYVIIAGFGAIGKTTLASKYDYIIDMESGNYKHINDNCLDVPVEKRKGTTIRKDNPDWPNNYYNAIIEAAKNYKIVLTSMHWHLLEFYEKNNIPYYLVFPKQGLEDEYRTRCYNRGNNEVFTEHMVNNIKIWGEMLKNYHPKKLILLNENEYLEDVLIKEGIIKKALNN